MTILRFFVSVLSLAVSCACVAQQNIPSTGDFSGRFVIDEIVGYDDVSGGIPQARKLLGKSIVISKKEIAFDGDRCNPANGFKISEVETEAAIKELFGVTASDAGLASRTKLLTGENCLPIFKRDEYQIVFDVDGIIVRAIRDNDSASNKLRRKSRK
jgi:hypothetical protein